MDAEHRTAEGCEGQAARATELHVGHDRFLLGVHGALVELQQCLPMANTLARLLARTCGGEVIEGARVLGTAAQTT